MSRLAIPACAALLALATAFPVAACPTGMLFDGNGCSPPYERNMDDWIRERRDYIDSLAPERPSKPALTREEAVRLEEMLARKEKEDEEKKRIHAAGVWNFDSTTTAEGKLCAAIFSKYRHDEGGVVSIVGFQNPRQEAWMLFYGVGLPKPKKVEKLSITLQQNDEPPQTVKAFNYRESLEVGVVAFAVPGLTSAVEGMTDKQSFKLSVGGKSLLAIAWDNGAKTIEALKQCAN